MSAGLLPKSVQINNGLFVELRFTWCKQNTLVVNIIKVSKFAHLIPYKAFHYVNFFRQCPARHNLLPRQSLFHSPSTAKSTTVNLTKLASFKDNKIPESTFRLQHYYKCQNSLLLKRLSHHADFHLFFSFWSKPKLRVIYLHGSFSKTSLPSFWP